MYYIQIHSQLFYIIYLKLNSSITSILTTEYTSTPPSIVCIFKKLRKRVNFFFHYFIGHLPLKKIENKTTNINQFIFVNRNWVRGKNTRPVLHYISINYEIPRWSCAGSVLFLLNYCLLVFECFFFFFQELHHDGIYIVSETNASIV